MDIFVTGVIERQKDDWLAFCPELEINTFGATEEDARESLEEAIIGYLQTAEASNRLEELRHVLETRSAQQLSFKKDVEEDEWLASPVG